MIANFTDKFTYIFIIVLPFLFLLYSLLRNKKGAPYAQKTVKLCSILCASSLLSGCWDQEPLREARLAYSIGFDITEENQLQQTVELVRSSGSQQSSFENEIHSATGRNIRDTSDTLKENVTGNIRYFKYGVQLLGTKIQKKGILPYLDISFRDPTNPTALVKLISVDGETAAILEKRK